MDENKLEKAERYLNNEMPAEERAAFELQIANDEELKNFVKLYSSIDDTMSAEDTTPAENELKQTLQQMGKKYFAGEGKLGQGNFRKWMTAAAAILVIALGVFYFLYQDKPSAEKLYAQFAVHEPLVIQQRGSGSDPVAAEAAAKFNSRHYDETLPLLKQYMEKNPEDIQVEFALAICNLEQGLYPEAERIFSRIASSQTAYADAATWYLALSALKQKDLSKCRNILNSIPQTSSFFTKATELLKELPD